MIDRIHFDNFGPLPNLDWSDLGPINLIIGKNGQGKSFVLKALYCAMRTLEEYKRGNDQRTLSEILAEKLYWTFQVDKIGDLVTKGKSEPLGFQLNIGKHAFRYSFGKDTTKQILNVESAIQARSSNSVFLPAKEVLSLHQIILKSREQDKIFGFDDTYLDLARALRRIPTKGKNYSAFALARNLLESLLEGRVEYDEDSGKWQFKKGNARFPIGVTAEGVKKIAILDTLLGNRYLNTESIVFIDEPESALHPEAVAEFLNIVAALAKEGIQFFLASHSYFVIKKLYIIAQKESISIPVISRSEDDWTSDNLAQGMPENSIINESIRLYEEEVGLVLG